MIQLSYSQKVNIGFQYVLDALAPCSAYGAALVKEIVPLGPGSEAQLERQYRNIARAMEHRFGQARLYDRLERFFMHIKDLRRTMEKCREDTLGEVELFELKRYLLTLEDIGPIFAEINETAQYEGILIKPVTPALDLLDPDKSRVATFYVSERHSPALAAVRRQKKEIEEQLRREGQVEALLARRRELAAAEEAEERVVREVISRALAPWLDELLRNADAIGQLDLTLQKAAIAAKYGGVQPRLGSAIAFTDMLSPQISDVLEAEGKAFTPISIRLEAGATVITGANMGGKSVALKTAALNVLLAACGFFPFAKEAEIRLVDGMFLISEDLQDAQRGLSSFGGEILRFREVCDRLGEGVHLVLLDEFARGTNPDEGAAIARAVTRYLNGQKNVFALLTTHYDGVAVHGRAHYQVVGLGRLDMEGMRRELAADLKQNPVSLIARHMNYGLVPVAKGQETPKDALNICRLLCLNDEILSLIESSY